MDTIETKEYKGYYIKIYQDTDPESPRDWDNLGHMVCFHNRYALGDDHDYKVSEVARLVEKENVLALPLFLYDHSGISMSTRSFHGRAHHAEWDSGQVGYIYVKNERIRKEYGKGDIKELRERAKKVLEGEVTTYDQYLRGEVYGYQIEDEDGDEIDSCWGYFGNPEEYMLTECYSTIDYHVKEQEKRYEKMALCGLA